MISLSFWTILKSRTNSKKANKSSNTKQEILDRDIKRALGLNPKALFLSNVHWSEILLQFSFYHSRLTDKYLSSIHYINSRREFLSEYITLVKTTRD